MPNCFSALFSRGNRSKILKDEQSVRCPDGNAAEELKRANSASVCGHRGPCAVGVWPEDLSSPPAYVQSGASKNLSDFDGDGKIGKTINETIDGISAELRTLSLDIHDHPELGFKEVHAHKVLTKFMREHGFEVEPHYNGLDTAWRAIFTKKSSASSKAVARTIGFNSEMDALPGIGHACGHNLIAIGGVAAALGVKAALEKHDIAGKVVLLGTPSEEGGGGKIILLKRGAYKDMDACLMLHPAPGAPSTAGVGSSLAIKHFSVEYHGQTAHASAAPWEGQNALDAAFIAYGAVSALRQEIKPDHRVHGIISGKDWAPNVIPDYCKMNYIVRAPTKDETNVLFERVKKCFQAGALATGCKMDITVGEDFMYDLRQNARLTDEFARAMGETGWKTLSGVPGAVGGSTDFGNVTYELPALHPAYAIPTEPNGGNHTRPFAAAAATQEAHDITLEVAKGIARAGFRILTDDEFFKAVRKSYEEQMKEK